MTPQHPAAPETETDANGIVALLATHRYMPCSQHTPTVNAWWAQCEGCDWRGPRRSQRHSDEGDHRLHLAGIIADAARERVRVVEGERDAVVAEVADVDTAYRAMFRQFEAMKADRDRAEAAHEAEKAAHERLRAEFVGARDDIRSRRQEFRRLNADEQYLSALDDAFGLVSNRLRAGGGAQ